MARKISAIPSTTQGASPWCASGFRRGFVLPLAFAAAACLPTQLLAADPPLVVAHNMVNAWNAVDADQIADLFAEDGVYQSMMDKPTVGRETIRSKFSALLKGVTMLELQLRNVAVSGDVVFLERIDVFTNNGKDGAVPVVAVLEIRDGKVAIWREYFDRAELLHEMGVSDPSH